MLNSIYQHRALEHLKRLPKFKHPLPKHQPHYEAVKDVVTKVAGSEISRKLCQIFLGPNFHLFVPVKLHGDQYLTKQTKYQAISPLRPIPTR